LEFFLVLEPGGEVGLLSRRQEFEPWRRARARRWYHPVFGSGASESLIAAFGMLWRHSIGAKGLMLGKQVRGSFLDLLTIASNLEQVGV